MHHTCSMYALGKHRQLQTEIEHHLLDKLLNLTGVKTAKRSLLSWLNEPHLLPVEINVFV